MNDLRTAPRLGGMPAHFNDFSRIDVSGDCDPGPRRLPGGFPSVFRGHRRTPPYWAPPAGESAAAKIEMQSRSRLIEPGRIVVDQDLLRLLRGRRLSAQLRHLCVIGAHRFDEKQMVDRIFPALQSIALFEPLEAPRRQLDAMARSDPRVRVFPYAVTDEDGQARFNVASNDGESSSLLDLGTHRELFPQVHFDRTIEVTTRRLSTALSEQKAAFPDVLIVDVQGAEYRVLSSLGTTILAGLRLIFTEVSTEAVYEGSRPLEEVERLLSPRFVNLGYAPLTPATPTHGNAVFVRREDVRSALSFTLEGKARRLKERLRRAWRS